MLLTPAYIKSKTSESRQNSFLIQGCRVSCLCVCLDIRCFHSLSSTQTFRRAAKASRDSYTEIKSAASVTPPVLAEFGGRCQKAMLGVCTRAPLTLLCPFLAAQMSAVLPVRLSLQSTSTMMSLRCTSICSSLL